MGQDQGQDTTGIRLAESDADILRCFDCMLELRPQLERGTFVARVRRLEREGFRLAGLEDGGRIVAVAGFRLMETLFAGPSLYVDDLVTLASERSQGHGRRLLDWLRSYAVEQGCETFHLDSGVQRARAHRFYFARGMTIVGFHFGETLRAR